MNHETKSRLSNYSFFFAVMQIEFHALFFIFQGFIPIIIRCLHIHTVPRIMYME